MITDLYQVLILMSITNILLLSYSRLITLNELTKFTGIFKKKSEYVQTTSIYVPLAAKYTLPANVAGFTKKISCVV